MKSLTNSLNAGFLLCAPCAPGFIMIPSSMIFKHGSKPADREAQNTCAQSCHEILKELFRIEKLRD